MGQLGAFTVDEIKPPRLRYNRDGSVNGTREFKATWSEADAIARQILPGTAQTSGGIIVSPGTSWPGRPWLLVESIDVTPFDDEYPGEVDNRDIATCPSGARLVVNYATLAVDEAQTGDEDGQTALSLSTQVGGEFLLIGSQNLKWESDDANNSDDTLEAHKLVITIEYVITVHRVPFLPLSAWQEMAGCVNSAVIPYLNNAAIGTVLFCGANANKTVSVQGSQQEQVDLWELELRFSQRLIRDGGDDGPYGWQHCYRKGTGTWDRILTADGNRLYAEKDLNTLLYPQTPAE